jgi:hypothetical protein
MDHSIKINRAFAQSQVGKYPRARAEALALIPETLLPWISSTSLAQLLDALHASHKAGRAVEAKSILEEGAVFDPRAGKMRELGKLFVPSAAPHPR